MKELKVNSLKSIIMRLTLMTLSILYLSIFISETTQSSQSSNKNDLTKTDEEEVSKIDVRVYREVKNSIHFNNMEDFQEWVYKNDVTFLTYYYSKNHTFSKMGAYYLYKLENKLDGLAKIVFIDCDEIKQRDKVNECNVKDKQGEYIFPRMKLAVPPREKYNPITKKVDIHTEVRYSENNVSTDLMYKFIINNLKSHTQILDSSNLKSFLQKPLLSKAIIFHEETHFNKTYGNKTERERERDIFIKGASNIYYDRIAIGEVYNNTLALEYGVKEFPNLVIFENNFFRFEKPTFKVLYKPFTQANLLSSLEENSLKEKNYLKRLIELSLEEVKIFPLFPHTYHIFMQKFENFNKIIFFVNSEKEFKLDINEEILSTK